MDALLAKLDEIEAEMRAIGFWRDPAPDGGETPMDGPDFAAWLQNTFLPNARARVQANDLPARSQVGVMAMRQYDYHSVCEKALPLVSLLHQFDDLVQNRPRRVDPARRTPT